MIMQLKSISAKGLVGQSFTHSLGPVTMIIGANATGKTARLRAIRLALLGYEPGVGEKSDRIFALSGADTMSVAVMMDDGKIIEREWRNVRGSIKSGVKGTGQLDIPVVLLDPSEYFGLSSDKRAEYVFNRVKIDAEKFSLKALVKRLKQLPTPTAAHHAAMTVCMNDLDFASQDTTSTVQDQLQAELHSLTETMKVQRAALDRMTKTISGMTELDLKAAGELTESLPSLNTKIAELEKELSDLSLQRDRLERLKAKIVGDPVQESIQLQTKINELEAKLENPVLLPDPSEAYAGACADLAALKAQQGSASGKAYELQNTLARERDKDVKRRNWQAEILSYEGQVSVIPDLQRQIGELEPVVGRYVIQEHKAQFVLQSAQVGVKAVEEKIDAKQADIEALDKELTKFLASEACPTCGAHDDGWKDVVKDQYAAKIEALKTQVEELEASYCQVQKESKKAKGQLLTATAQDKEHFTRQNALHSLQNRLGDALLAQTKVDRLKSAIEALGPIQDYSEAIAQCEQNLKELGEKVVQAEAKVAELEKAKAEHQEQQTQQSKYRHDIWLLKTDLASLGSVIAEMKELGVTDAESLQGRIHCLLVVVADNTQALRDCRARLEKALATQQDIARHKAAEGERNKAEAELEVLKLVREEVKSFRNEMVQAAWGPILERANAIAAPILKTPLGIRDNQLGRWGDDRQVNWIDTSTFSGTEQAVTYAALSIALAQDSPFKLCLVDEMTRMDEANKTAFIASILQLQRDGVIDQFIGVDTDKAAYQRAVKHHEDGTVSTKPLEDLTLILLK